MSDGARSGRRRQKRVEVLPVHIHEAAHVVAGQAAGLRPDYVWCDAARNTGKVEWRSSERAFGVNGTRRASLGRVLVALAGGVAEDVFTRKGLCSSMDDIRRAAEAVARARPGVFSVRGRGAAHRIMLRRKRVRAETVGLFQTECGRHARAFVEARRHDILAVAAALVGGGVVTAAEIEKVAAASQVQGWRMNRRAT